MNDKPNEKSKKSRRTPAIILILLLLLLIGISFSFCHAGTDHTAGGGSSPSSQSGPGSSSLDNNGNALSGGYTEKSRQQILAELEKKQVTVTDEVSSALSFSGGAKGAVGSWVVENPSSNNVTEQCEIMLNGESIAESVPINPGQHIETITLSKQVNEGTYDVTAIISYYSTDTRFYLGKAGYRLKLTIS